MLLWHNLSPISLQTNSLAQKWTKLSEQLRKAHRDLKPQLQQRLVPKAWGALQKGFNIMVEVFQVKMQAKEVPSVSASVGMFAVL
jgi:hypothetical protein